MWHEQLSRLSQVLPCAVYFGPVIFPHKPSFCAHSKPPHTKLGASLQTPVDFGQSVHQLMCCGSHWTVCATVCYLLAPWHTSPSIFIHQNTNCTPLSCLLSLNSEPCTCTAGLVQSMFSLSVFFFLTFEVFDMCTDPLNVDNISDRSVWLKGAWRPHASGSGFRTVTSWCYTSCN